MLRLLALTLAFSAGSSGLQFLALQVPYAALRLADVRPFAWLFASALLGLWFLYYAAFGLVPWVRATRSGSTLRGSLADRYAWATPPFLVWSSVTGLAFEPSFLGAVFGGFPYAPVVAAAPWLVLTAGVCHLAFRVANAIASRFRLLPDGGWPLYLAVGGLWAAGALGIVPVWEKEQRVRPAAAAPPSGSEVSVVLFGIDGADWRSIDELVSKGRLPAFARLRAEGVTANLDNVGTNPSPAIWASIATGRNREGHGVIDFFEHYVPAWEMRIPRFWLNPFSALTPLYAERRQIQYVHWLAQPIWRVMSERGRNVLVVNWFFTYPVLPVNGVMIADHPDFFERMCALDIDGIASRGGSVTPPDLAIAGPERICDWPARASQLLAPFRSTPELPAEETESDADAMLRHLLQDGLARETFLELREGGDFDLAVYMTRMVDAVSHRYSDRVFGLGVRDEYSDRLQRTIDLTYQEADAAIGRILESSDSHTLVAVVSDHGWDYDGRAHGHWPPGILAFWGAPVEAGAPLDHPTIFDIAPTVMWLAGAPLSREFEGRILTEAFRKDAAPPARWVAAYGPHRGGADRGYQSDEERRHLDELKALGYVR